MLGSYIESLFTTFKETAPENKTALISDFQERIDAINLYEDFNPRVSHPLQE